MKLRDIKFGERFRYPADSPVIGIYIKVNPWYHPTTRDLMKENKITIIKVDDWYIDFEHLDTIIERINP